MEIEIKRAWRDRMDVGLASSISKVQFVTTHAPYCWHWLKSLPYGATRRITHGKCRGYSIMEPFLRDKYGLEIGGPSPIFSGNKLVPVYDRCRNMDNSNFSRRTIWDQAQSSLERGFTFRSEYVAEASQLSQIPDGAYDFLLASHVLEHLANPLQALQEWRRVLGPGGSMLVIVPDPRGTFDHRREPTSFEHIEEDFRNNITEEDLTHLDEILALHDLNLDPEAGSAAQFRQRCLRNAAVRAMHHHVFVPEVLVRMFSRVQMRVLSIVIERPSHIIAFAQRVEAAQREEAELINDVLRETAPWKKYDPLKKTAPAARPGGNVAGKR